MEFSMLLRESEPQSYAQGDVIFRATERHGGGQNSLSARPHRSDQVRTPRGDDATIRHLRHEAHGGPHPRHEPEPVGSDAARPLHASPSGYARNDRAVPSMNDGSRRAGRIRTADLLTPSQAR